MTGFLDDNAVEVLRRDLRVVIRLEPELLRIARREVSPPGGRAARNPNVPGSRPPVNLSALDAAIDIRESLLNWGRRLADDTGVDLPDDTTVPTLARWQAGHLARIAARDWSPEYADTVAGHARRLRWAVEPPEAKYVGPCQADGPPLCRGLFTGDGRDGHCGKCGVEFDLQAVAAATEERMWQAYRDRNGTPMELARWMQELGVKVTNKTITYWGRSGAIVQRGQVVDGPRVSPLYNLGEVEDVARRRKRTG